MTTVMHGRRRGQAKDAGPPPEFAVHGMPPQPGMTLPDGTDIRQVTVLTGADWNRINTQLHRRQIAQEKQQKAREERERIRAVSKDMVKDWTNTIVGSRKKKLEARKIREAKDEEEKQAIDLEEAKFQAQKRKEAIEKAKTQQYYQTDRVKGFHSALQLTEVLKERDAQVELKMLKEKASLGQDKDYLEKARKDHEEAILDDQRKALERMQASKQTSQFQKAQIREHLKHRLRGEIQDRKEGEELQKLAIQYHEEKERLEAIRTQEVTDLMKTNLKQIKDVKKMKEIQQEQEDEEDEECRLFAAAKRKMMKLRAEKERTLHNSKLERLDKIREKLAAQMKMAKDDEDDRIRKAIEEAEEKRAKEEEKKNRKQAEMLSSIAENRFSQMRQREAAAAAERRKELEMLAVRREADVIFQQNEEEKHHRKFAENRTLADMYLDEVEHGKLSLRKEHEAQLAQDKKNMELLEIEEKQFQEYANRVVEHCDKRGRNVYPLRKAAKAGAGGGLGPQFLGKGGIRPSYMTQDNTGVQLPNYTRSTTQDVKEGIYGNGQTGKRLGFVW